MPGFDSGSVMYALNVDFTGNSLTAGTAQVVSNGQLLIGSTALPNIRVGTLTSPNGTLTIGYSSPNITLDLVNGLKALQTITVDTTTGGGVNPVVPNAAGNITFTGGQYAPGTFGARAVTIDSTAVNTLAVGLQISSANASSLITNNGLCNFNSSYFTVDANGFVALANPSGFPWTDVTVATQTLATNHGYVTDRGGGVTYTLPATAVLGDTMKIVGKAGITTVTQNANQQIIMGTADSTVGVGGSIAGTDEADCVELICTTAGASTVWTASNFVGNWTVT